VRFRVQRRGGEVVECVSGFRTVEGW